MLASSANLQRGYNKPTRIVDRVDTAKVVCFSPVPRKPMTHYKYKLNGGFPRIKVSRCEALDIKSGLAQA